MNPFFQTRWMDAHTALIGYLRDALNGELPDDLTAQAEEGIQVTGDTPPMRADVAVVDRWRSGFPPVWTPEGSRVSEGSVAVQVAEPHVIPDDDPRRWVEIRATSGDLVTVIEIISPANKRDGQIAYAAKRQRYRDGRVNVVEIDLIRGGTPITLIPFSWREYWLGKGNRLDYEVAVWRTSVSRIEAYPISLRDKLPAIRIPLRLEDPDVPLALQPLVDECHVNGRYWQLHDLTQLRPRLCPEDEAWAQARLREAGL